MLDCELKNKNWSLEEKARYIYLRSCELFSYDPRYCFSPIVKNGLQLEKNIFNRKIDLENVENFDVVCSSHAEVLDQLFTQLLNIKTTIVLGPHVFNQIIINDLEFEMDPSIFLDFTRVKMGLRPEGYILKNEDYTNFKLMDKKIEYISEEYESFYLKNYKQYLNKIYRNLSTDEKNRKYLEEIQTIFQSYKKLKNFSDAEYCLRILMKTFFNIYCATIFLFQENYNAPWNFVNIYMIPFQNDYLYFMLEEQKQKLLFHETNKQEALYLTRTLNGKNKNALLLEDKKE